MTKIIFYYFNEIKIKLGLGYFYIRSFCYNVTLASVFMIFYSHISDHISDQINVTVSAAAC